MRLTWRFANEWSCDCWDWRSIYPFFPRFSALSGGSGLTATKHLSPQPCKDRVTVTATIPSSNSFPMMPSSDYASAAGGGLRLKGVNPSSKISKHKKKRPKPAEQPSNPTNTDPNLKSQEPRHDTPDKTPDEKLKPDEIHDQDEGVFSRAGKTEAELRHEERRRRRVCTLLSLNLPITSPLSFPSAHLVHD